MTEVSWSDTADGNGLLMDSKDAGLRDLIAQDIASHYRYASRPRPSMIRVMTNACIHAAILVRLLLAFPKVAPFWRRILISSHGIDVSRLAKIGAGLNLPHPTSIVIGRAILGRNVTIYHGVTIGQIEGECPTIGDDVTIWPGAVIVGPIEIGNGCVIAPNSVVRSSAGSGTVVGTG